MSMRNRVTLKYMKVIFMFQYRKILGMHSEDFSLCSIASTTEHSRQKVSGVVQKAMVRDVAYPLTDEMTDHWLEELLFLEKAMEGSGYRPMDFKYIHRKLGKKGQSKVTSS